MKRTRALCCGILLLLLFFSASTETVLASQGCGVYLLETAKAAGQVIRDKSAPVRRHSKTTIEAWRVWGEAYFAKHGHSYVPPKRKVALKAMSPEDQARQFKFACEALPLPTTDLLLTTSFPLLDVPPPLSSIMGEMTYPPESESPPDTETPFTPGLTPPGDTDGGYPPLVVGSIPPSPIGPPPGNTGGGPTPPPVVGPIAATPEPGSFLLLGTGFVALWLMRRHAPRLRTVRG